MSKSLKDVSREPKSSATPVADREVKTIPRPTT